MSILQGTQQRHRIGMRRKLRRREYSNFPFFPYWALPALCLGLLSLFATSCVHSRTQDTTTEALGKIGADWVRPVVSGRWVTLAGTPPSAADASAAYEAVNTARSKTLFGGGVQATRVSENYNIASGAISASDGTDSSSDATAVAAEATDHNWRFDRKDNVMTLSGEVPDEAMRSSLIESAEFTSNGARIADELTVTNRTAKAGYSTTALRGVQSLGRCTSGIATFEGNVFALTCEAAQADAINLRRLASAPLSLGEIGEIEILATEDIASCENQLGSLLSNARVEFATGSAVINATSSDLLTSIAREASTCPGVLRIEGHTDNRGSEQLNADLSRARANAVRLALISRGLPGDRLTVEGFGPSRPLASNDTELGRARNRRIQFSVVRP